MSTRSIVIPLASNQTGLSLSAQLVLSGGGASGGAITSGFTELGNGFYLWTYASFPSQFRGCVTLSSAGSIVAAVAINPEEAEDVASLYSSGVEVASYASGQDPATLVWGAGSRTLSAFGFTISANMTEIAGQTVAAAGTVTFPASVGTSTYAGGAVASVAAPVTVGTNSDKTGYSLATAPPTASAITTAVVAGMASAPVGSVAAPVTVGTNNDKSGYELASNGFDSIVIEIGLNARQGLALIAAASAGVLAGAGTGPITIEGAGVATNRITASTDSNGNRTSVTLNLPT
jgi:hypothetical protein